jgi:hypothetical protein
MTMPQRVTPDPAGEEGDRAQAERPPEAAADLWADASRGELRLLRHAIRHGWDVPDERRRPIMDAVCEVSEAAYAAGDYTRFFAAVHVIIEAEAHNQRLELAKHRAARDPTGR